MPLTTTTIGAFPKPDYVPISDWFSAPNGTDTADPTRDYEMELARAGGAADALFARATADVVADQADAGIDIITDGEVRRENYIHYHCRRLAGIDFAVRTEKQLRGHYKASLPTITGPVRAGTPFLGQEWRTAQAMTTRPLKMTLPGPLTIGDTVADAHYGDARVRGHDLARAINAEVRDLAAAGCRHIQIDEPLFARQAANALAFGLDHLAACFEGVDAGVTRTVHICCGYPNELDAVDYPKAPRESYLELAEALDGADIDAVSLEDAHRPNALGELLPRFRDTIVVFGAVAIARSAVEPAALIAARLREALRFIEAERLWVAPDCGLGFLGRELALAKLRNMTAAARMVG